MANCAEDGTIDTRTSVPIDSPGSMPSLRSSPKPSFTFLCPFVVARLLFHTDLRVRAFAMEQSDVVVYRQPGERVPVEYVRPEDVRGDAGVRFYRVLSLMWERNEHGWRSECEERARAMMEEEWGTHWSPRNGTP